MAEIARMGSPSVSSALTLAGNRLNGSLAGEDLAAGDACYLSDDGKVYRSIASSTGAASDVRGFAEADTTRDEPVTLAFDVTMHYGQGLPQGRSLYLSGTVPGGLADSPSSGGTEQVAFVVDATRVHLLQTRDRPASGQVTAPRMRVKRKRAAGKGEVQSHV